MFIQISHSLEFLNLEKLKVAKGNNSSVYVPTTKAKSGRTKPVEKQVRESAPVVIQEPAPSPSTHNLPQESGNSHEGISIMSYYC